MLNTDNIDKQAVFAAENSFAEMFEQQGIDAAPGTAIRELIIRPSAVNRSLEEEWRTNLLQSLNMNMVANGTIPGDDEIVDAVASIYRITRRTGSVSSGVMMLELNQTTDVYVNSNLSFYVNGHKLSFDGIWKGTTSGTGPAIPGVNYTKIINYPKSIDTDGTVTYSNCIMIPVYSKEGANIATGATVTVTGPTGLIKAASIFSPLVGGGTTETNQELASRILESLPPGVLSTPLQIKNTIGENFGRSPDRTAVIGSQDGSDRSIDPLTGFRLPGFVDVYTAYPGDVQLETTSIVAVPYGVAQAEHLVNLEPPFSSGVYDVVSITVEGVPYAPTQVDRYATTSNHRLTDQTATFSAYQSIWAYFPYPGSSSVNCDVTVRKQSGIDTIQGFVDASERRAPGQDTLVKAACPVFLNVSISVEGGSSVSDVDMKQTICSHINNLPIGRGYISGQDFTDALNPLGVKIAFPITMRATIIDQLGVSHEVVSVNSRLDVANYTVGGVFYLSESNLQVTSR